ncbi:MAG: HAD hydrolase-like protein [Lentimicrobium sp.]|jgi:phosphoglycolate phosphatase|nr:HAD hydrolase-like protein [Lentimicrobium sp.]
MRTIQNLIWDFNGTLLNDLDLCLNSINSLLDKRNLLPLDKPRYHDIFTFPIKDYYSSAGFDFERESFEEVAIEFIDLFLSGLPKVQLHSEVIPSLDFFRQNGFRQIILSAMQQDELKRIIELHQIESYFEGIFGINDHYANGKTDVAIHAMQQCGFLAERTCLLGDTLHDAEVAKYLGTDCILIADGHQSAERLATSGFRVIKSLGEIHHCF